MAENDSTDLPDLIESEGQVTLSKRRTLVALEASWEIEQLCTAMRTSCTDDGNIDMRVVRGISKRIADLAGAIMSALSDKSHSTDDLCLNVLLEEGGAA